MSNLNGNFSRRAMLQLTASLSGLALTNTAQPLLAAVPTAQAQDKTVREITAADGVKLSYVIEGQGIPCVVVNRSNYQRVYAPELRKHLKMIFLDFRHNREADAAINLDSLTLDTLVDDIEQVRKQLSLGKIAVMGHSTPSVFALEYARKYPEHTSHVIVTGAAPFAITPPMREAFWQADASAARKQADER